MVEQEETSLSATFREEIERIKDDFQSKFSDRDGGNRRSLGNVFAAHRLEEEHFVEKMYKEESWQRKLFHFMESHTVQVTLLGLLFADIIIVIAELFIEGHYPACAAIEDMPDDYVFSCCPADAHANSEDEHRFLSSTSASSTKDHYYCATGYEENFVSGIGCNEHALEEIHVVHTVLFVISLTMLCIFEVELLLKLFILRKHFWSNKFFMVDLFVVTLSIVLDVLLRKGGLAEAVSALVLVRLWRFVRIIHGVYMENLGMETDSTSERNDAVNEYVDKIEELVKKHLDQISTKKAVE